MNSACAVSLTVQTDSLPSVRNVITLNSFALILYVHAKCLFRIIRDCVSAIWLVKVISHRFQTLSGTWLVHFSSLVCLPVLLGRPTLWEFLVVSLSQLVLFVKIVCRHLCMFSRMVTGGIKYSMYCICIQQTLKKYNVTE